MSNVQDNRHWTMRLAYALAPTVTEKMAARYRAQSNSGQIVTGDPRRSAYPTRLQAQWRSGGTRGSRADPIYPIAAGPSMYAQPPWPHRAGRNMPTDRVRGMDQRPLYAGDVRPSYLARDERLEQGHSRTGQKCDGLLNRNGFEGTAGVSAGGAASVRRAPNRIPRMHRPGLALMGGPSQFGTRQTWGQGPQSLVIAPAQLQLNAKSRGVRSVRGSLAPNRAGSGRERIPAIFTPTAVK